MANQSLVIVFPTSLRRSLQNDPLLPQILDIDLDVWRRRGGDQAAGAGTVGNNKPGVGIEERNFSQDERSVSHSAALRVQVILVLILIGPRPPQCT